jgi:hypothetical protein
MDFGAFPFDQHRWTGGRNSMVFSRCMFFLRSLADQEEIVWAVPTISTFKTFSNDNFEISLERSDITELRGSVSGFYLFIKRNPRSMGYTYFLPCGLLVLISWVSFAINYDVVPGRLGLLLTVLLMIININNSLVDTIPASETICPLTQWTLTSIIFIVLALFEYFLLLLVTKFQLVGAGAAPRDPHAWALRMDRGALALLPAAYLVFIAIFVTTIFHL